MFKYHNNYTYCSSHNQLFLFIAAITLVVITQLFFREASNNLRLVFTIIPLHEKFLQFDWLRAAVFQLNLKYLHVKITNLLWVVV